MTTRFSGAVLRGEKILREVAGSSPVAVERAVKLRNA